MSVFIKVGTKGQIVIPKIFREASGIAPGMRVAIEEKEGNGLLIKKQANIAEVFEQIAMKGKSIKVKPHDSYDEEMEKRTELLKQK
jgi:AbrB family looped-hinge helix DNA binding protein